MTSTTKLKEDFEVESKHGAFYTGGNIEWHEDTIYCQTSCAVKLLDTESGSITKTIGEEESEEADFIQTFTTDGERLITSHKSGLLKLWNSNGELEKMWKYIHKGPIAKLALNGNKLASGGSDSTIRIWDLTHQACTMSLKGCQGVINVVNFHPNDNSLFGSGDDGKINYYTLENGQLSVIYDRHYSKVTSVVFAADDKHFVSSGRDKVLILWEFNKKTALRTIAVYESIEVIVLIPPKTKTPSGKLKDSIYVASSGDNGIIRIWDVPEAKEIFIQNNSMVSKSSQEGGLAITHLIYNKKLKALAVVSAEHNIIIHHLKSFVCLKQFIGFSDEILDLSFVGKDENHIAVATNSNDIKLYEYNTMNCTLLKGHTDIVLSLSTSKTNPNLMLSSSKDNSIRLWLFDESNSMTCIGYGARHTGSIASVEFAQTSTQFAVSVSQDTCIKVWEIPEISKKINSTASLSCLYTQIAHQKDINCVAVSPNDKIIATASQDKTAKLWTESLTLVGVLKGHKRGVWAIRFSPVDQVVLTSSADCTIKIWNVADLSCLKTFEGHESSVLRIEFISKGMQILSTGADGLMKLFNTKTSDCLKTFDQHEGKIWALAIKNDESTIVTGGSDSLLIKWKDVTEERKLERIKESEEQALQEQQLSNYLQKDDLLNALKLSLRLNKPLQTLKIVQNVIKKGETGLADTINGLREDQKDNLLKCALNWNMNSKYCQPAQLVMNILLEQIQQDRFRPSNVRTMLETAMPYTERHFKRLTQLMQDLHFINYTVNCMVPHAKSV